MIGEITPFDLRWPVVVASLLIAVSSFGHLEVPTLHIKAAKSASELHNLYNTIYIFIPRWTNQSSVCHEFKNTGACLKWPCLHDFLRNRHYILLRTWVYVIDMYTSERTQSMHPFSWFTNNKRFWHVRN